MTLLHNLSQELLGYEVDIIAASCLVLATFDKICINSSESFRESPAVGSCNT